MKLEKIIAAAQDLIHGNASEDPKRKAALEELMVKLDKKKAKLRKKLKKAETAAERADYERKLKIVVAQREKGKKVLAAMSS
jgi:hypothetical protein